MSWSNPTQQEAQDCYDEARSRYNNAAEGYCQCKSAYENTFSEYSSAKNQCNSMQGDKLDFQKRLADLESVLSLLRENGKVNETVGDYNKSADSAGSALKGCVVCDGVNCPDLATVFKSKDVDDDQDSALAHQILKSEKARLENAIKEVDAQISAMEQNLTDLTKRMNSLFSQQCSYKNVMNASAFDMNHYKNYT
ncbi:MAG: hypothetical protein IKP95_08845 [Ruminococcus sp.]|nr:hypothetical protein [Ruminococcus sp.]